MELASLLKESWELDPDGRLRGKSEDATSFTYLGEEAISWFERVVRDAT